MQPAVSRGLFAAIDADEFEQAIYGKTLRGTLQQHQRAIQLLSVLDHQTGDVLNQTQIDPQTNEEKAAIQLLETLVLRSRRKFRRRPLSYANRVCPTSSGGC